MTNTQGPEQPSAEPTFREELTKVLNARGVDSEFDIPDYILADYLNGSLEVLRKFKANVYNHFNDLED